MCDAVKGRSVIWLEPQSLPQEMGMCDTVQGRSIIVDSKL